MASGIVDAFRNALLDLEFGGTAHSAAATHYFGLCTGITDAGVITGEPSGNNYARKGITNDKDLWTDAASGALDNEVVITFNEASGDWGTLSHFFIANDSSGDGNTKIIAYGALTASKTIGNGDTPSFAIGDLDIELNATA